MDWIFEHFQVFLLVGLAVAGWLKTRWEARAERENEEPTEWTESQPYEPSDGSPPPFVPAPVDRTPPPPLPGGTYTASPVVVEEFSRALKHQQDLADRLRLVHENRANTTGGAAATRSRLAARGRPAVLTPAAITLNKRLRNPAEIRAAIVLREILDKPLGLR